MTKQDLEEQVQRQALIIDALQQELARLSVQEVFA